MGENQKKESRLGRFVTGGGLAMLIAAGAMFFAFGGLDLLPGVGSAATLTSRDQECAQSIRKALEVFRDEGGMPFAIKPTAPRDLFSEGSVTMQYRRDGMRQDVSFRVHKDEEGCNLRMFRRVRRQPGERSSSSGNFGEVKLPGCSCEES